MRYTVGVDEKAKVDKKQECVKRIFRKIDIPDGAFKVGDVMQLTSAEGPLDSQSNDKTRHS